MEYRRGDRESICVAISPTVAVERRELDGWIDGWMDVVIDTKTVL